MTQSVVRFAIFVGLVPAFAQLDAYKLREKYGQPLDRETFAVRPGVEMIVDYGPAKQVCRIQLPSGTPSSIPGAVTERQIEEVLDEVVPVSTRGKLANRSMWAFGAPMHSTFMYEHVTINEFKDGDAGAGITVTFNDPSCQK